MPITAIRSNGWLVSNKASSAPTVADGRSWLAQVDGGNGHSGVRSPEVHVGVGAVGPGELLEVEIAWRDGAGVHRERYRLAAGRHAIVLGRQATRSAA